MNVDKIIVVDQYWVIDGDEKFFQISFKPYSFRYSHELAPVFALCA